MGAPAARIGDAHLCPLVEGLTPHVGGPIVTGASRTLVGGAPAARFGDQLVCAGPPDVIASASASVIIEGRAAARLGDRTVHGGVIVTGAADVLIGG